MWNAFLKVKKDSVKSIEHMYALEEKKVEFSINISLTLLTLILTLILILTLTLTLNYNIKISDKKR
jgi:hypothetical protein